MFFLSRRGVLGARRGTPRRYEDRRKGESQPFGIFHLEFPQWKNKTQRAGKTGATARRVAHPHNSFRNHNDWRTT